MDRVALLRDCILVRVQPQTKQSKIELPEEVKQRQKMEATHGVVVAVGPECEVVEVGNRVLYKEFVGHILEDELIPKDGDHIVVSENDVLCCFKDNGLN